MNHVSALAPWSECRPAPMFYKMNMSKGPRGQQGTPVADCALNYPRDNEKRNVSNGNERLALARACLHKSILYQMDLLFGLRFISRRLVLGNGRSGRKRAHDWRWERASACGGGERDPAAAPLGSRVSQKSINIGL